MQLYDTPYQHGIHQVPPKILTNLVNQTNRGFSRAQYRVATTRFGVGQRFQWACDKNLIAMEHNDSYHPLNEVISESTLKALWARVGRSVVDAHRTWDPDADPFMSLVFDLYMLRSISPTPLSKYTPNRMDNFIPLALNGGRFHRGGFELSNKTIPFKTGEMFSYAADANGSTTLQLPQPDKRGGKLLMMNIGLK